LWLNDLVRQGLASVQNQPTKFWEQQAARLRDAQAGGLDARVRRLATIPNASPDWPGKLLDELGKIALLTHAFRREDQLGPGLREDIRQLIGFNLSQEEVAARGETVRDEWLLLGQTVSEDTRDKMQQTWLYGLHSGRPAQIVQYSYAGQPFVEQFPLGARQESELTFWPSASPLRAFMRTRLGDVAPIVDALPGVAGVGELFDRVAQDLARQPWQERFLCVLRQVVVPVWDERDWYVVDQHGDALKLTTTQEHKPLLALTGGHPVDLAAVWDGVQITPLGVLNAGNYTLVGRPN
jgi:hypothetical protein